MATHIDKNTLKHIAVCFIGAFFGWYGLSFVAGCAVTKEWDDSKQKGNHWCWVDIAADCLGMALGTITHKLVFGSWGQF